MNRVTGLWGQTGKQGNYLGGRISRTKLLEAINALDGDELKFLVFKNDRRRGEKDPEYALCLGVYQRAPERAQEGGDGGDIPF